MFVGGGGGDPKTSIPDGNLVVLLGLDIGITIALARDERAMAVADALGVGGLHRSLLSLRELGTCLGFRYPAGRAHPTHCGVCLISSG